MAKISPHTHTAVARLYLALAIWLSCFNSPQDLRAPSADRCETLPRHPLVNVISIWVNFIMQVQKFGAHPLKKFTAR